MSEGDGSTAEYSVGGSSDVVTPDDDTGVGWQPAADADDRRFARRRWTPLGIVVRAVLAVVVLGLLYYAVTLYQVWSTGRRDEARAVDAIVVLGAAQYDGRPSPQLASRLDHVMTLWQQDLAPLVVVTGGKQPGDRFTEAEASARYLVDRGVPESALLFENEGGSTYESLEGVAALLRERNLRTALLVTDPYHALRSRLTAEELGIDAYVSPTETSVVTGASSFGRHLKEAAGVSLGRVMGFDRLRGLTG